MSASEQTKDAAESSAEEVQVPQSGGEPHDGAHKVPLFLRGRSDGSKGDAQDEKDEAAE